MTTTSPRSNDPSRTELIKPKRNPLACTRCRQRKVRCEPVPRSTKGDKCMRCVKYSLDCEYIPMSSETSAEMSPAYASPPPQSSSHLAEGRPAQCALCLERNLACDSNGRNCSLCTQLGFTCTWPPAYEHGGRPYEMPATHYADPMSFGAPSHSGAVSAYDYHQPGSHSAEPRGMVGPSTSTPTRYYPGQQVAYNTPVYEDSARFNVSPGAAGQRGSGPYTQYEASSSGQGVSFGEHRPHQCSCTSGPGGSLSNALGQCYCTLQSHCGCYSTTRPSTPYRPHR